MENIYLSKRVQHLRKETLTFIHFLSFTEKFASNTYSKIKKCLLIFYESLNNICDIYSFEIPRIWISKLLQNEHK